MPKFSALLRKFYRQTHPDLLRATHPSYADINDKSWQVLNGILSTVKECNSYPPRTTKSIPFYMKGKGTEHHSTNHKHDEMLCLELTIVTGGGDCKRQFTKTLQHFFVASEISTDGRFIWDKEYFPIEPK